MIDFRYHLVSIVAVFLALATGLVLGSTVIDNVVLEGAKRQQDETTARNEKLQSDLAALQDQDQANDGFVKAMAPKLLSGTLDKKRVVVVQAPGADRDQAEQVSAGVKQAGGTVTGTVALADSYIAKNKVGVLGGLTETLAKNGDLNVPSDAVPAERAAYLLGNALVTDDSAKLGKSDDASTATLTSFKEAKFVTTTGSPEKRASLAVVVGPEQQYGSKQAEAGNTAVVSLAKEMGEQGEGSVLSAPTDSAQPDGVVAALRDDEAVSKSVSSVDNLDAPPGYVTTIMALALDGQDKPGHWGSGEGADGAAPAPPSGP